LTANSAIRKIAATNDGIAAEIALVTSTDVSVMPGRSPASTPMPIPITKMISDAYSSHIATSATAHARRGHILPKRYRDAQVSVQGVVQPIPILGEERLVQVIARLEHLQAAGRQGPAAGQRSDRVPWRQVKRPEDNEAGDKQAGDKHRQPAGQEPPAH
jgi:hypothetical protein